MIKSVIFDWGGVLIDNPTKPIRSYCASHLNVSEKAFAQVYKKFEDNFQKGKITEDNLWKKICNELKVQKPRTESLWTDAFQQAYSPKKEMFSLAKTIYDNGYKVGILSNTETPAAEFFRKQAYAMYDAAIFSCSEGTAKPEREIYEIILKKLWLKPQEAIFIDDRKDYIKGAKQVGINTILFKSPKQVKKELKNLIKI